MLQFLGAFLWTYFLFSFNMFTNLLLFSIFFFLILKDKTIIMTFVTEYFSYFRFRLPLLLNVRLFTIFLSFSFFFYRKTHFTKKNKQKNFTLIYLHETSEIHGEIVLKSSNYLSTMCYVSYMYCLLTFLNSSELL